MRQPVRTTATITLDARADRLDLRDRAYTPEVRHLPASFPAAETIAAQWQAYIDAGYVLDQGSDGACTGFGLAAVIHYLNWMRGQPVSVRSPRMIYHLAQFYDEWPGEDYIGSSCRGALKGWHKHGVCRLGLWPYTVKADGSVAPFEALKTGWAEDALQCTLGIYYRVDSSDITLMQAAIAQTGAIYASATVHAGWDQLATVSRKKQTLHSMDSIPLIQPHPHKNGTHAFALIGYNQHGFVVQNSWGDGWGAQGLALLSYDDWLAHGTDAWTLAMGVPALPAARQAAVYEPLTLPAYRRYPLQARAITQAAQARLPALSTDQAYALSMIMDSNARVIQRLVQFGSAADSVTYLACEAALAWHQAQSRRGKLRLVLYAPSGLRSEEEQIQDIAALAPLFLANRMYPVFLTWNNGLSGLHDRLQASYAGGTPGLAQNRSIEAQADNSGIKAMWTQMKHNAALATANDQPLRGLTALHRALKTLAQRLGDEAFELHLVAHSAGALLAGHCLTQFKEFSFQSCQLIAPACSLAFANQHFGKALQSGRLSQQQFRLYVAATKHEQEQHTAGVYQGSLLRLISNALEDRSQTPLLGMASSSDAACLPRRDNPHSEFNQACLGEMESWLQTYWQGHPASGFALQGKALNARQARQLQVFRHGNDHESIDQNPQILEALLMTISGRKT